MDPAHLWGKALSSTALLVFEPAHDNTDVYTLTDSFPRSYLKILATQCILVSESTTQILALHCNFNTHICGGHVVDPYNDLHMF